jgi:hypothetical protein
MADAKSIDPLANRLGLTAKGAIRGAANGERAAFM